MTFYFVCLFVVYENDANDFRIQKKKKQFSIRKRKNQHEIFEFCQEINYFVSFISFGFHFCET